MGRGLGPFQREVLQRIGKHMTTFGDAAKAGDIAKEMALARGVMPTVEDDLGTVHKLDVAHAIGLRRAMAVLERRGLVTRYVGGWVELTEAGAAVVGECEPTTKEEIGADASAGLDAVRRRKEAAIALGRLKPNGARWD
jgi:hypothetical protein